MEAIQSAVGKMGGNFSIGALIPSFSFVLAFALFEPFAGPFQQKFHVATGSEGFLEFIAILLIIAVLLGFTLSKLNTFFHKVFEGYIFFDKIPSLRKRQIRKAKILQNKIKQLKTQMEKIGLVYEKDQDPSTKRKYDMLGDKLYELAAYYELKYPPGLSQILPTSYGNVLKAAEAYPGTRYGMDAVTLWPRLLSVIPKKYIDKVDFTNDSVSFLMNCSVLSSVYMLICMVGLLGEGIEKLFNTGCGNDLVSFVWGIIISACLFLAFTGIAFFSIPQYANAIRCSFDLYRFDLLEQLHQELPVNRKDERDIWLVLSEFFACGDTIGEIAINYTVPPKK